MKFIIPIASHELNLNVILSISGRSRSETPEPIDLSLGKSLSSVMGDIAAFNSKMRRKLDKSSGIIVYPRPKQPQNLNKTDEEQAKQWEEINLSEEKIRRLKEEASYKNFLYFQILAIWDQFWMIFHEFYWFLMDFCEFWWFFWILMDFLVHSIYNYLVWVCPCVRASLDRFWPNDKFQFLGFRIFWSHFLSRFLPNSLKNHQKVNFSLVFYIFSNFRV